MSLHDASGPFGELREARLARQLTRRVWPVALVLTSALLFLVGTRHGIGVYVDSTRYMGLSEVPYDAPLYPWLLKLSVLSGLSMDEAARALGFFFVCANTALVWHLLLSGTQHVGLAALGTAIAVVSPQFVALHALAMSEPPFLFLLLVTVLLFLRYLGSRGRSRLLACALALGLAALTRFTAPALGTAIALCLLIDPRMPPRRRIAHATLFAGASAAVFLGWVVLSQTTEGHSIGRELSFHGNMGTTQWLNSLGTLAAWLLPDEVPFGIRVALLAAVAASVAALAAGEIRRLSTASDRAPVDIGGSLAVVLALFLASYLAFMVLATSIEANLSLNARYAFPAYVAAVMMTTVLAARLERRCNAAAFGLLVALAVVVLPSHLARTALRSEEAYRSGIGYASPAWRGSPTVAAVDALPPDAVLFSNGQDALAYLLGRQSRSIPKHFELRTGLPRPDRPWAAQIAELRQALARPDSYVVFFDRVDWRFYQAREDELVSLLPLDLVRREGDGRIYRMRPAKSMPQT